MKATIHLLLLLVLLHFPWLVVAPCPCNDESLCRPIDGPPAREREIYGFALASGTDGAEMNWTHITTVAWAHTDALICRAHAHGARAILAAPPFDLQRDMVVPARRAAWIQAAVQLVQDKFADGLVFDYESPQPAGSSAGHAYAALIAETRVALQAVHAGYQVSTCVPWSPDNIDGRAFPWLSLAAASDLLYVMDYDTRSQIFDACVASANAPLPGMIRGLQRYFDIGVEPQKLVLGVPWYGYRYTCLPGTAPNTTYCPIQRVPFRGVNCSDAAGIEVDYAGIQHTLSTTNATLTGGLRRDDHMDAPFFNALAKNSTTTVYQFWYDDATSLRHKYAWAKQQNLRGVGPYTFSFLDHNGKDADMWSAFDVFLEEDSSSLLRGGVVRQER